MPVPRKYHVWEWFDPSRGGRHYVGYGRIQQSRPPWEVLWHNRCKGRSELDDWLCQWPHPPSPSGTLPREPLFKTEAAEFAWTRIQQLRLLGAQVMSRRAAGSWTGGGKNRAVAGPQGQQYASVREAAQAEGVSAATITRRCQNPFSGWKYEELTTA